MVKTFLDNRIFEKTFYLRFLTEVKTRPFIIAFITVFLIAEGFNGLLAQTPLPNPDLIPTCPYNIIFALDESGSIVSSSNGSSIVSTVRNGAKDLISTLNGTGSKVVVVEFNAAARIAVIGGMTTYQTINTAYVSAFNNYINADGNSTPSASNYDPEDYGCRSNQCYTNWESAFNQIENINATIGLADLVIFFTDGMPTAYIDINGNTVIGTDASGTAQALAEAIGAANAVKLQGSHIFVIGIPNPNLPESNIWQISGPDRYPNPESDFAKGDYSVSNSTTLQQDLSRIAHAVCIVDLRLEKSANMPSACAGDTVTFYLTLFNDGIDRGSDIIVQDVIPSGYTYVNDNGGNATNETGGIVTWNISGLNPSASVSLQIRVITNSSGNYRNTAQVIECPQTDIDSSPANDDGDQSEDDEAFSIVYVPALSNTTSQVTICDNETYFAGGALQNTTGAYADTFSVASGCDSVHVTNLTVLPTYRQLLRIPICQGDSIYLGGYYRTQSGAYNDSFIAQNGCDSIFTTVVVIPNCNDNDLCTDDFCISGVCTYEAVECDDNNPCTLDSCVSGSCLNSPLDCEMMISGYVLSEIGAGIPNATVHMTGTTDSTTLTDIDGYYVFNTTQGGSYTITPSKNNDIQIANGITTLDIAFITRHVLALQLLSSPYKVIAGDVNGSGTVTTIDALIMSRFVIGDITAFPNSKLWEFVNSDYVFPDPLHPFPFANTRTFNNVAQPFFNQNFIGVKLGDVNNSWNPTIP